MTYTYTKTFGSAVLAPCLQQLCEEIAASPTYRNLTNLGEIGDTTHQTQGYGSDHNPFIIGPAGSDYPGLGYVRAIDLGGDAATLLKLRDKLHALYIAQDPRVYPFGYFKGPDSQISDWFGTGYHTDTGDEGHLHVSVTQADGYNPSPSGWVPALDSRARWGIDSTTQTEDDDMTPEQAKMLEQIHTALGGVGTDASDNNAYSFGERLKRLGTLVTEIQADVEAIKAKVCQ